ncbi:MAG: hypothetical protein IBJ10_04590 [Phycisphaerales bacterium]|nr:hypothetical protein [Phycisphaerales bacterium]
MPTLLAIYLSLLSLSILVLMIVQFVRRQVELLSIRNFFLLGLIVFQLTSAIPPIVTQTNNRYSLQNWTSAGFQFSVMASIFLALFFLFYRWGPGAKQLARLVPTTRVVPPEPLLFFLAIALTVAAFVGRVGVEIPNNTVSALFGKVALAFAAMACGMAGWIWAPRLFNPIIAIFAAGIVVVNLGLVLSETFGRRPLVAIGAALLWGMYYSYWRNLKFTQVAPRLALIAIPPVVLLAAFTSVRESQQRLALGQRVSQLTNTSNLDEGFLDLLSGQNCAPTSMWLIDNYPERFEYRHLMTIKYFFMLPIPRAIWHEKPEPLSTEIASKARIQGVRQDELKIGPGVVGHAAAEGGWYALVIYGVVAGLFIRFFDELVRLKPWNPYIVLPIGSAMGQVVGLPRGDAAVFGANYVAAVLGAYLSILVIAKVLGAAGLGRVEDEVIGHAPAEDGYSEDGADADEYADAAHA